MDIRLRSFMEGTITNLKRAIQDSNPELTMAVLTNLQEVLPSWLTAAHNDYHEMLEPTGRKEIFIKRTKTKEFL